MKSPEQFYKDEISSLTSQEQALSRKSNIYVASKLILFCSIIASIRRLASASLARLPVHLGLWRMLRQKPAIKHIH